MPRKNTSISASKSQLGGRPSMKEAVPLGLRHVLTMFVGDTIPMILVASATNLPVQDANILPQCCMLGAAISTAIQLYSIRIRSIQIGSGLPYVMGPTYMFLPVCLSIVGNRGISCIFGAQIAAGVITISYGTLLKKMSSFFPPVATGTIVIIVGVPILNLAIGNVAGGTLSPDFRAPINWTVGVFVVLVIPGFNVFGKGFPKVAAILIGTTVGCILSVILGPVSFSGTGEVAWFVFPKSFAFGVKFDLEYTPMFVLFYFIVAVQMIGDFNVPCMGGLDREPTPGKVGGGTTTDGITSIISATSNNFPIVTYSQNSGIVALTRMYSHFVILVGYGILFLAGLCPKASAMLSAIPSRVIGGGTVVVFTMITTSGMRPPAKVGYSNRNRLIIGVSLAFGLGIQLCKGASVQPLAGIATMLEENSTILTPLLTIVLNLVFPEDPVQAEEPAGKIQ